MITIVRVEEHLDRINQMLASATGHDTIVIIRAPQHPARSDRAASVSVSTSFAHEISEEEQITWEDAEWQ